MTIKVYGNKHTAGLYTDEPFDVKKFIESFDQILSKIEDTEESQNK